jgi:hypothetical protein
MISLRRGERSKYLPSVTAPATHASGSRLATIQSANRSDTTSKRRKNTGDPASSPPPALLAGCSPAAAWPGSTHRARSTNNTAQPGWQAAPRQGSQACQPQLGGRRRRLLAERGAELQTQLAARRGGAAASRARGIRIQVICHLFLLDVFLYFLVVLGEAQFFSLKSFEWKMACDMANSKAGTALIAFGLSDMQSRRIDRLIKQIHVC